MRNNEKKRLEPQRCKLHRITSAATHPDDHCHIKRTCSMRGCCIALTSPNPLNKLANIAPVVVREGTGSGWERRANDAAWTIAG
jgi:hypothetical protein